MNCHMTDEERRYVEALYAEAEAIRELTAARVSMAIDWRGLIALELKYTEAVNERAAALTTWELTRRMRAGKAKNGMSIYDELRAELAKRRGQGIASTVETDAIVEIVGHLEGIAAKLDTISVKLDRMATKQEENNARLDALIVAVNRIRREHVK